VILMYRTRRASVKASCAAVCQRPVIVCAIGSTYISPGSDGRDDFAARLPPITDAPMKKCVSRPNLLVIRKALAPGCFSIDSTHRARSV
jgi:hypothetical protein